MKTKLLAFTSQTQIEQSKEPEASISPFGLKAKERIALLCYFSKDYWISKVSEEKFVKKDNFANLAADDLALQASDSDLLILARGGERHAVWMSNSRKCEE